MLLLLLFLKTIKIITTNKVILPELPVRGKRFAVIAGGRPDHALGLQYSISISAEAPYDRPFTSSHTPAAWLTSEGLICGIKYCVFSKILKYIPDSGLSRFPLGVSVCTQWQVKAQRLQQNWQR